MSASAAARAASWPCASSTRTTAPVSSRPSSTPAACRCTSATARCWRCASTPWWPWPSAAASCSRTPRRWCAGCASWPRPRRSWPSCCARTWRRSAGRTCATRSTAWAPGPWPAAPRVRCATSSGWSSPSCEHRRPVPLCTDRVNGDAPSGRDGCARAGSAGMVVADVATPPIAHLARGARTPARTCRPDRRGRGSLQGAARPRGTHPRRGAGRVYRHFIVAAPAFGRVHGEMHAMRVSVLPCSCAGLLLAAHALAFDGPGSGAVQALPLPETTPAPQGQPLQRQTGMVVLPRDHDEKIVVRSVEPDSVVGDYRIDFEAMDANGDGVIDRREAAANPALLDEFRAVDANNDGRLDREELSGLIR